MLTAIRRAYLAKQNMTAGTAPVNRELVDLIPQSRRTGEAKVFAAGLESSPCGQFMSVVLQGDTDFAASLGLWDRCTGPPAARYRKGLALFKTGEGTQKLWQFSEAYHDPVVQWARESPHLSMVMLSAADQPSEAGTVSELVQACVYNAQTGAIVHELGLENRRHLLLLWQACYTEQYWCATGQFLLVISHESKAAKRQGCFTLFDVWADKLVAQSGATMGLQGCSSCIAISYGVSMDRPEAFQAAGLALVSRQGMNRMGSHPTADTCKPKILCSGYMTSLAQHHIFTLPETMSFHCTLLLEHPARSCMGDSREYCHSVITYRTIC